MCRSCLGEPAPFDAEYFCTACGTPFQNAFPLDEEGRCGLCRSGLRGFDAAHCYGGYHGVLRQLIHLLKYAGVRSLAAPLSGFLARAMPRETRYDAIVPVPLHWRKRWQRGFNQADLLARPVGKRLGIPVIQALRRVRATPAQASLSMAERRHNVNSAAFAVRADVAGQRILLVDDVMTTGSTGAACALVLKRAGAARVGLLTVARVDRRLDTLVPMATLQGEDAFENGR